MSLSQLLTFSESHVFRALMSLAVWILGLAAQFGRGLRSLLSGDEPFARIDVGRGSWLGILSGDMAIARKVPMFRSDTYGESGTSPVQSRRQQPRGGGLRYSPALAFARQAHEPRGGRD